MSGDIKVMLVDDHAVVRMGFRLLLEGSSDIEVVAEAESGEEAVRQFPEVQPDVVVMDHLDAGHRRARGDRPHPGARAGVRSPGAVRPTRTPCTRARAQGRARRAISPSAAPRRR